MNRDLVGCAPRDGHGETQLVQMTDSRGNGGSRLLQAVEVIAISPEDAVAIADQYVVKARQRFPRESEWSHQLRAANKIVRRYSKLAAMVGVGSALPGVIPGLGTAVAMIGGGTTDALVCMKLQVDMCMCLAATFKYEIASEDEKHLAFLIAATGTVQHAGGDVVARVGSKAGVSMLRQYLKGGALQATKQAFSRVGLTFTRKAAEKAIPFGVGAAVAGTVNYVFTRYVGRQAKEWFIIDRTMKSEDLEDKSETMNHRASWLPWPRRR